MNINIWVAVALTLGLALAWLRINDFMAHRGWISGPLSRKIIHIGTGPIFVLCWLLFPDQPAARYLAALVPGAITVQFAAVGLGLMKDQAAVDAMSRHGDRREILRGPLFYGIVFVVMTILFWKDSPIGIIALMLLCGGDGLADIVGKRFGHAGRLPWSPNKSWAGSLAMLLGGWLFTVLVLAVFLAAGVFSGSLMDYLPGISLIALVGAAAESLPVNDIDNLTVPALAVFLGWLMLPKG
ncbi:MAG TPA: phosphatidate cytidylyltransferase [Anaerolineaceae bacterium]|nr:phosphatidate cytidylyltransferase [Anaerolineaceae bacterium]